MTKPDENTTPSNLPAAGADIVSSLSRKQAFPVSVDSVEVRQTHISEVFLGDNVVYKVKKPVKLPFLDFSTVELRHHFCHEEVRINSPWAPGIYLGVVPITTDADGYRFEGDGPVADWAVKMRRLPEDVTLRSRLNRGELSKHDCERVARRIAEIHRTSMPASGDDAANAVTTFRSQLNDNWQFAEQLPGGIVDREVMERIRSLSDQWLGRCGDLLQTRATLGLIRDVHGDLRLEHVFYFPESSPPGDIVILDGIEFDPGLRLIDVVADIAFMTMELSFVGRRDLAEAFAEAYFTESGDSTGRDVLPLFAAYRSAVRAKVAAILATESEVPEVDRNKGLTRSRSHWLWCLCELETPGRRPALVLVSGLPGTGKSTLARSLAEKARFEVIRSDVIRKEIFTVESSEQTGSLYTSDRTQRIYEECLERARRLLQAGKRVIIDATFQRDQDRQTFLQLAIDCGSRAIWLECTASAEITRQRIDARHGDASDADWSVYQLVSSRWQPASEPTERFHQRIETGLSGESACDAAMIVLRQSGIVD
jgi:aminoglycoside phosphotransferase family enzyme/predicted kinase